MPFLLIDIISSYCITLFNLGCRYINNREKNFFKNICVILLFSYIIFNNLIWSIKIAKKISLKVLSTKYLEVY